MKLTASITGHERLQADLAQFGAAPRRALDLAAEEIETYIEGQVARHNKTGKLFASIYKRRVPDGWEIGNDQQIARHALFVHWGTRPHVIRPKNKRALRWSAGGKFAFAKRVNHPGYKGDPWVVRAAALAPAAFDRHLQSLLSKEQGNAAALSLR